MKILSCDTSTKVCSVAIHAEGRLVASVETFAENSHAENLAVMIEQVCTLAKISLEHIDAFALSKGPGSYTGLRIGCSMVKGLCFVQDKPLIGLSTLQIMANGFSPYLKEDSLVCPLIDARRMEVYTAVYNKWGEKKLAPQPLILEDDSFAEYLETSEMVFIGDGANKTADLIKNKNARFVPDFPPLARHMGFLALEAFQNQHFEDLAYFEPEYLKEFYTTAKLV